MAHLTLALLGGFQAELDGRPVTGFKSSKVRALLAYLAVEADRPHRRETLAGLLWPERPDRDALNNLRYSLANLRKTLDDRASGTPFLLIDRDTVQFNRASDAWLDVNQLLEPIAAARSAHATDSLSPPTITDLQSALALYRGSLLAGFSAGDAAPFEEWLLLRREQIEQQVTWTLASLTAIHEARADYPQAQAWARRHVALEPWNEDAHRALMRGLALDGQRSAALHQFQVCRRILADELGVEPAEETLVLFEAIRKGGWTGQERRKQGPLAHDSRGAYSPAPPLVAREGQLSQLGQALAAALAGAGSMVFVVGEAGSGKTALLRAFTRRAMQAHAGLLVADGACDAATGIGDPYLPFREILQLLTGDIEPKRTGAGLAPEHARRLWMAMPDAMQALATQGPDLIDTLAPAAGLELRAEAFARQSGSSAWQALLAQLRRPAAADSRTVRQSLQVVDIFDQVTHVLLALARQHPLVLVLDDLQWADSGSIGLLFHLGRRLAGSRILIIGAYRPDALAMQGANQRHPLELVVNELCRIANQEPIDLDACEGRAFIEALLETEPNRLGHVFRQQLLQRTEGHPLFTVELLRSMEERGDLVRDADGCWTEGTALHWDRLPTRVEAAIAERVGRLPERCRTLLAAASVEGQEFTAETVAQALGEEKRATVQCLSAELGQRQQLVAAVSVERLGAQKLSGYRFRHHLFQKYFYDHLDPIQRYHLHEAVGSAMEALYGEAPDRLSALAPRLAWHFEMAGLAERAAAYHLRAGSQAARVSAHTEAVAHLRRGLALLEPLPDTPERTRLKLDLYLAVAHPLSMMRGFWDPERIHALNCAYQLAQHADLSNSPERCAPLAAVAYFALWSAQTGDALAIGNDIRQLAEREQNEHATWIAHSLLGSTLAIRAELADARHHLDRALDGCERRGIDQLDLVIGVPVDVVSLCLRAVVLWLLGYPGHACDDAARALALARDSAHASALAFAHSATSLLLFVFGRDPEAARRQVEALRLARGEGIPMKAWFGSLISWAPAADGEDETILQQMRQATETFRSLSTGIGYGAQIVRLAQHYARKGNVKEGLDGLSEAQIWIDRSGIRLLEPEVHRLRGELLCANQAVQEDAFEAAEKSFRQAIALAREQGSRWWELRATVSLHRLLREQGPACDTRRMETRQMLTDLYASFSEGFSSLDLREAQEALEAG